MKRENQTNALLVELLIVILFFMLGAAILIQVFAKSYQLEKRAQDEASAYVEAQNAAEMLYALPEGETADALADIGRVLEEAGYEQAEDGVYKLAADGYDLEVTVSENQLVSGIYLEMQVQALRDGEVLMTLPCSHYLADASRDDDAAEVRSEESLEEEAEALTEAEGTDEALTEADIMADETTEAET